MCQKSFQQICLRIDIYDLAYPKHTSEELDANPVCSQELKQINERISHLEKINYEKFGPTDYAALKFGGEVISVVSKLQRDGSFLKKIQKIFSTLNEGDDYKQCIIQDCGTCYAFPGNSGYVVLKLMGNVVLDGITIEHIPLHSNPKKMKSYSALKEFSVVGMKKLGDRNTETYLGTFTFSYDNDFLETFTLTSDPPIPVRYVRVEIHSNHGENYTCIYRIRIHGTLEQ
ncbi:SUN domain-containing protein 3 [Anopheles ziemanni]|uniref:SUN domain-containing protein 3 n=1 Tax=Anopheles ziemanni TaxID=345580 RepID=UPI00265DF2F4|nr:SUN domain-containing protein 3 [Anopheles ziemanni]